MPDQDQVKKVFQPVAERIRREVKDDIDFLRMLGEMIQGDTKTAFAFSQHAADILEGNNHEDVDYPELAVQAFWRTFFDGELSKKYGTDSFSGNLRLMELYVAQMVTHEQSENGDMGANVIPITSASPLQH